ncbi:MAG: hypothetical protein WCY97_08165 [Methanothrix sp.]|jgi:hypothetical protein|uniref:Uncharacterized protein n=1 Tax=Methanothrix harundinacea TaxID=301375 RepID=A0A124FMH8_9EURY|nr:MAG: hypothetical protein APR56_06305 [Methanosaeta sp. SDB]KUK44817.1 MAG: Uncharacterized protein XD72_0777 [Methanothrix harundinacea]MDD2639027.1 hypothetical protein [Methanothrix sp.]MDI9398381.1 hypothetical protein [Euryarchaeota archaeon]KUK96300.1 MAG: Uncharacterized protein XE07_1237 [Methanothrix harundinacea]
MRRTVTLGGAFALLLLMALSAAGNDMENATEVEEDLWADIDADLIASKVDVKDISGMYADVTESVYIGIDENDTTPYPYQETETYIWTIEQRGSLLLGKIEGSDGETYQIMGSTAMDELCLVYYGNVTYDGDDWLVEGFMDGNILETGEIVLNGIGYEYAADSEDPDNYEFSSYFAETTVLTPIEEE